jgi:serine/threonine protein phosphatase 1
MSTGDESRAKSEQAKSSLLGRLLSPLSKKRQGTRAPENMRIYAVGDVHGCLPQLERLLESIGRDVKDWKGLRRLVFLGDYIDRGPDSKGVVERLRSSFESFETSFLLGNHDQTLLDFLDDPSVFRAWRDYGARETLMSYGVVPPRFDDDDAFVKTRDALRDALPAEHEVFLRGLELSVSHGDYCFVHAGVRPGVALEKQAREDLLWIRDEFLLSSTDFGKVVVHGHTPTQDPVRRKNRIGVDTGAYATGRLTCAVLEGTSVRFLSVT